MPPPNSGDFNVLIGPTNLNQQGIDCLNRLLRQLSDSSKELDMKTIKSILSQPNFRLIVLKNPETGEIVGMTTLHFEKTLSNPDGIGKVEDVVVDERYRGLGLGERLMKFLIILAKTLNLSRLNLSSNPHNLSRATAIKLYEKLGFKVREGYFFLDLK